MRPPLKLMVLLAIPLFTGALVFAADDNVPCPESSAAAVVQEPAPETPAPVATEAPAPVMPIVERGPIAAASDNPTLIQGRVVGISAMRPGDAPSNHIIADVETDSGYTYEVDLGVASQFHPGPAGVATGDVISFAARPGTADGVPMLIADNFRTQTGATASTAAVAANENEQPSNQPIAEIPQPQNVSQQSEPARQMNSGIRQRLVAGEVIDVRDMKYEGQNEDRVLAKIKTFGGHIAIVDLGRRADLPAIKLEKGAQIAAFGTVGRLNDRPLIVAEKVAEIKDVPGRGEQAQPASVPENPESEPTPQAR